MSITTTYSPSHGVIAFVDTTSRTHFQRRVVLIELCSATIETPLGEPLPLLHRIADILHEQPGAWQLHFDTTVPLSITALRDELLTVYPHRAFAVAIQWHMTSAPIVTGVLTCGPATLGSDEWRVASTFASDHRVHLTLSSLQLMMRVWFTLLGSRWPQTLTWRATCGSIQCRRGLELMLLFHAKRPGLRQPEFWDNIHVRDTTSSSKSYVDVVLSAPADFLDDLATWGVGIPSWWTAQGAHGRLLDSTSLPPTWDGHVFHSAPIPTHARGFQHCVQEERCHVLGTAATHALECIAKVPSKDKVAASLSPPRPTIETSSSALFSSTTVSLEQPQRTPLKESPVGMLLSMLTAHRPRNLWAWGNARRVAVDWPSGTLQTPPGVCVDNTENATSSLHSSAASEQNRSPPFHNVVAPSMCCISTTGLSAPTIFSPTLESATSAARWFGPQPRLRCSPGGSTHFDFANTLEAEQRPRSTGATPTCQQDDQPTCGAPAPPLGGAGGSYRDMLPFAEMLGPTVEEDAEEYDEHSCASSPSRTPSSSPPRLTLVRSC